MPHIPPVEDMLCLPDIRLLRWTFGENDHDPRDRIFYDGYVGRSYKEVPRFSHRVGLIRGLTTEKRGDMFGCRSCDSGDTGTCHIPYQFEK